MRTALLGALAALALSGAVAAHPPSPGPAAGKAASARAPQLRLAARTLQMTRGGSPILVPRMSRPRVSVASTRSRSSALDAVVDRDLTVYRRPRGPVRLRLAAADALGSRRVLLVVARRSDGWLRVRLPIRPNGTTGWIRRKDVQLQRTPWRVVVSLSQRRLTLLRSGTVVRRYTVGVGSSSTPTPTGLFSVTDRILTGDPGGAYGPVAFGLSGFSDVLHSFNGGPGQIAIHGTDQSSTIGHAASFGCVHVPSARIMTLYPDLQLGTPVLIES